MSFFSAHDNSIVSLVNALQLQVGHVVPDYGAIVAFELYEHPPTNAHYLKVLFEEQEVTFAGHDHAALTPFAHFEAIALEFLCVETDDKSANNAPSHL